jgi:alpha-D-xyloside xylohydrolase
MKGFQWTDLEWDPDVFPDPPAMLARLKARGLHTCLWINPYIAQMSKLFSEGAANGYLLKRSNGDVWQWDNWQPGMAVVDFTNPEAVGWFKQKLRLLIEQGVDALKTDFGERIPTDVVFHNGAEPERMHNYYSLLYNRAAYEVLEEVKGQGQGVLFARSATAGGQKYPVHWGGDCWSEFYAMAESLRGGLSLGLCGFGFWSHDIGGFEGLPRAEIYKRWVAFGLLSSHSRLHGSSTYRVPWLYDDEAVDTLRFFTKLKCKLMPYLYEAAVKASKTGVPVMRPMLVEFPDDPACLGLDRQYMLGESLLVAPVMSDTNRVQFYVPTGTWTNVISGEELQGPAWFDQTHGFLSLPLLARPNSIVAFGAEDRRPDYPYEIGIRFEVFRLADGATARARVVGQDGIVVGEFAADRIGSSIRFRVSGQMTGWSVLLVNVRSSAPSDEAEFEATERGLWVKPRLKEGASELEIQLLWG